MSILYLSRYNNENYIADVFRDEIELARYFAYGYILNKKQHDYDSSRYDRFIKRQMFSENDVYFNCEHNYELWYCGRNLMLYDEESQRQINLKDYTWLIEKHIQNPVYETEYSCHQRKSKTAKRLNRQGKTHRKSYVCRWIKSCDKNDYYSQLHYSNIEMVAVKHLPKASVRFCDDKICRCENNWKQAKVKHQWQWHMKKKADLTASNSFKRDYAYSLWNNEI